MSDLIKKVKIKKQNGTYTDYIPIGAEAKNVDCADGESVEYKLNKKPYYYNCVADMKADTNLKVGDMAITLGYYKIGDDGGSKYRILSTSDNYYEELNNNLLAELIIDGTMNIRQFGCYCDNIHDDTEKLQIAINKSKRIAFNDNVIISQQININTQIEIDGFNYIIKGVSNTELKKPMFAITSDNVIIKNLKMNCNHVFHTGCNCNGVTKIEISNCEIWLPDQANSGGTGIACYNSSRILIKDNYIHDCCNNDGAINSGDGIYFRKCNDTLVQNNRIDNCGRHNMAIVGYVSAETSQIAHKVLNNFFSNSYLSGVDTECGNNILIDGNTLINNGHSGGGYLSSALAFKADGNVAPNHIIISNNNIKNAGNSGIHASNFSHTFNITSNQIDGGVNGINLHEANGTYKVIIANNILKNLAYGITEYINADNRRSELIITSNNLDTISSSAFSGTTFYNSVISNNIFSNINQMFDSVTLVKTSFINNLCYNIINKFSGTFNFTDTRVIGNSFYWTNQNPERSALINLGIGAIHGNFIFTENTLESYAEKFLYFGGYTDEQIPNQYPYVIFDNNLKTILSNEENSI